jgi:hypothetical protein
MAVNILPVYGQSAPTQTAPAGPGDLGGSSYEGAVGNSISGIPGVGGALNGLISSIYGTKPATANPIDTAAAAITGNIGNLNSIGDLTTGADTISAENASLPYQMNLPNYSDMLQMSAGNVGQELSGQLPQDVQNQIQQAAAARGISTGQGAGSPNTGAAELADMGMNSLQMQQMGQQGFGQLMQETPTGTPQMSPESMFVTPQQQQEAQQYANMIAAAPDPEGLGLANTIGGMYGLSF